MFGSDEVVNLRLTMSFVRNHQKVLILADEPMAAALIAALVERARLQPAFADTGESADEALARTKPMLGILIDALTNTSQSDLFLARARSRNVSVALFCEVSQKARQLEWASAHRIPVFGLPTDTDALHAWLASLAEPPAKARGRRGQRRRQPTATREADGTIVLLDARGVRWLVYDRRFADRRSDMTERHFVSDAGEERGCTLAQNEEGDVSPTALSDQLARSNVIN